MSKEKSEKREPLDPNDFPVEAHDKTILKSDGEPIADVCDKDTAEDMADRLNEHEYQREQDRWSA